MVNGALTCLKASSHLNSQYASHTPERAKICSMNPVKKHNPENQEPCGSVITHRGEADAYYFSPKLSLFPNAVRTLLLGCTVMKNHVNSPTSPGTLKPSLLQYVAFGQTQMHS